MSVTTLPITLEGLRSLLAVSRNSDQERVGRIGQEWEIREFAENNHIEIVDHLKEFKVKRDTPLLLRPVLIDAVRRCQAGEAQGLLFRNQDRIGEHAEELVNTLDQFGGVVVTAWDGVLQPCRETEDEHIARLFETARMADERRRTRLRAKAGREAKAARGGNIGGRRLNPRYGYELVQDFPVPGREDYRPIPEQQHIIDRLIAADPNHGGEGWQAIANQLNTEGVPGPTNKGWRRDAAYKIARNEARIRHNTHHGLIAITPQPLPTPNTQATNHNVAGIGALATVRNRGVARAR